MANAVAVNLRVENCKEVDIIIVLLTNLYMPMLRNCMFFTFLACHIACTVMLATDSFPPCIPTFLCTSRWFLSIWPGYVLRSIVSVWSWCCISVDEVLYL